MSQQASFGQTFGQLASTYCGKFLPLELEYRFQVDSLPKGDLHLALEKPERLEISLNGNPVSTENAYGWWIDRSLRRIPLNPAFLKQSGNTLSLRIDYNFTGLQRFFS